jgi:hypothetical protein
MRKLILALVAAATVSAGCCRFCDDRDRHYYTPAARPVSAGAPGR